MMIILTYNFTDVFEKVVTYLSNLWC